MYLFGFHPFVEGGTGGGDVYLTGCLDVEVALSQFSIDIGPETQDVDVVVQSLTVDVGMDDVDMNISTEIVDTKHGDCI